MSVQVEYGDSFLVEVEATTEEAAIYLIMSGEEDAYNSEVETDANGLEIVDVMKLKKLNVEFWIQKIVLKNSKKYLLDKLKSRISGFFW